MRDPGRWSGGGSTSIVPPAQYWAHLAHAFSARQVDELRTFSDARQNEFSPSSLPPPEDAAVALLERLVADGWLATEKRWTCPNCERNLSDEDAAGTSCPECDQPYAAHGGVRPPETVYVRHLAPARSVEWVVAIHGMNTSGAWQESFTWLLATTWGRSVPVAVYKYGRVIAGVLMTWRRRSLRRNLRLKLAALNDEARKRGFAGRPDVVAHSFGTWLFGHLLLHEVERKPEERLRFGRVVLAGCALRTDFDWKTIQENGLVEEVLNHYGTRDIVVPWSHIAIADSGPSGRRGFDGGQVLNLRAEGFGHSDLLTTDKCVVDGRHSRPCTGSAGETRHLDYVYARFWRPYLTLPREDLRRLPDLVDPPTAWRPLPWPLRGTLLPLFVFPLLLALIALLVGLLGDLVEPARSTLWLVVQVGAAGVGVLVGSAGLIALWRWLWRRRV